ncbi:phosphoribosyltransferase family protein [Flavobacteriaceae bacterium]|nr:phosphoribosyltransferase family protein [Flavobacteriaceae bacterium]
MKYRSQNILGNYIFFKALTLLPYFKEIQFVIPVPLFKGKELKRGGNQLDEFGKKLAQFYHTHYNKGVLIKEKNTKSHSEKTKFQRDQLDNYHFKLAKPELLKGKSILLIDDLITTGNTIQAATQVLFQASCKKIHIMCIASGID